MDDIIHLWGFLFFMKGGRHRGLGALSMKNMYNDR